MNAIVPISRVPVTVRPAVAGDYPFIDRLQDMHSKALGFMRKAALEGKIKLGEVLIAEEGSGFRVQGSGNAGEEFLSSLNPEPRTPNPLGYCISSNRYLKRDELGVVYQMNVMPVQQRKLIGATLLKEVFERSPYGCKLFCCWCAQDLDANYFWESLGFVPLAFRTGAVGRKGTRTHIFWQRRIREGDTMTPYWFPAKTDGGMMREDRLVLPIPPGVHWKDPMPILIPEAPKALPEPKPEKKRTLMPRRGGACSLARSPSRRRLSRKQSLRSRSARRSKPIRCTSARRGSCAIGGWRRSTRIQRFLSGGAQGKYDVSRAIEASVVSESPVKLLSAA